MYRYTTTPPASGRVIDAMTQEPITGAMVGFRNHDRKTSTTTQDGSFQVESDHIWAFSPLIPWEFTPRGGVFFVEAPGYSLFETNVGEHMYRPLTFPEPIALRRDLE